MFEIIDKSLSELLKKTANQKKVWFLSYSDSKKRIFPRRRANWVAPTVCHCTLLGTCYDHYSSVGLCLISIARTPFKKSKN
jgi:hypothetical protein